MKTYLLHKAGYISEIRSPIESILTYGIFDYKIIFSIWFCRSNYCGGCNAEWFVEDEMVQCDDGEYDLPPALQTVNCSSPAKQCVCEI